MNELIQLFNDIHLILERYEQIRKEKGENYNLFQVINMTNDETRVHSALIADLLNPHGHHQMDNVFLQSFINRLNGQSPCKLSFAYENVKVECEKYIGPKTETSRGRLDLYITDGRNHIVIENKIYATDQENQLLRYHNYLKQYKNCDTMLLYLSLDGEVHDLEKTTGGENINFFTISYGDFILNWLEDCGRIAHDKPMISEGIRQYKNLIKILTHQMESEKNELIELIKANPQYICFLPKFKDAIKEVEIGLYTDFWTKLETVFQKCDYLPVQQSYDGYKYALDKNYVRTYYESNKCKYQSIEFTIKEFGIYRLMLRVEVDWRTYYGILIRDNNNKIIPIQEVPSIENPELNSIILQIKELLKDAPDIYHSSNNWLFWKYTTPIINFRDLSDDNCAYNLSKMNETVERIANDIVENINMTMNIYPQEYENRTTR
ncbi:PD-(D/E)XK nuclease family protein [Phocaeicola plebeius]|uniref:PDDEXK-like family protein n=1 Tax=Phocaeicola plebeius TaxID=310297 RepID=UPI0026F15629|nr:PD-(D/E)XK nuclease family protein [Phocaeicola plebeius]